MPKDVNDTDLENGAINQEDPQPGTTEANEDGSSASEETLPFDKHPKWIAARKVEKKVDGILEEHGYESMEDMLEDLSTSKSLVKDVGNKDIKKLIEAQEELDKIKSFWAQKEMEKLRDNDPDAYIQKLEADLKKERETRLNEEEDRKLGKEEKQLITRYEKTVRNSMDDSEAAEYEKELFNTVFGLNDFVDTVDISDKKSVKQAVSRLKKSISEHDAKVIEAYRDGKIKIPKTAPVDNSATPLEDGKPKNIKDSKKIILELLKKRQNE